MSKPRVTALHHAEPTTLGTLCEPKRYTTPGVLLEVEFDLHDHEAALAALDRAVEDIRSQIEETK